MTKFKHIQAVRVAERMRNGESLVAALNSEMRPTMQDGSFPPVSEVADEAVALFGAADASVSYNENYDVVSFNSRTTPDGVAYNLGQQFYSRSMNPSICDYCDHSEEDHDWATFECNIPSCDCEGFIHGGPVLMQDRREL